MTQLSAKYWEQRYVDKNTGWDVGDVVPQWKAYFKDSTAIDKGKRILVPGAGLGHEVEYLHRAGFQDVHILDWSSSAIESFQQRLPTFPKAHCHVGDFFEHSGQYDVIVEQTFFCAINPSLREQYVLAIDNLLAENGQWAAILFNTRFDGEGPPFGGSIDEYIDLFKGVFKELIIDENPISIEPRKGREVFVIGRR